MENEFLEIAIDAVLAASNRAMIDFQKVKKPKNKGRIDLVTKTDLECEKIIKSIIKAKYPKHGILAEESGHDYRESEYLWVIDPIDGTTNFVHGCPPFSISVGLYSKNSPLISLVLELPLMRMYTAISGKGAWCEGEPIKCSKTSDVLTSLLATGFSYKQDKKWDLNMLLFKKLTRESQGVRRFGSAALDICYVADGRLDGFWEFNLQPWDTAAGILIAKEAGCVITNIKGDGFDIFQDNILVSNGHLHAELIKIISNVKTDF